ncbi:protein translocase subunit SecF [Brachyspira sp. CAG:484]|nr:protein translocase subunit SecF [Brachyspira sp. CAG:484]
MTDIAKHVIDIVKYRVVWLCISAILLLPGTAALIYSAIHNEHHIPLKVGIDYTGGTILQYGVNQKIDNNDIAKTRADLEAAGVENPLLQVVHANAGADSKENSNLQNIISIRTKFIGENTDGVNKITEVLSKDYTNPELISVSSVGPTLGKELFKNSLLALGLAFLGIVIYLSIRFKFDYALAAILGIAHDVLFVVGAFSLLGIFYNVQIDGLFITAILTVVGFSVHDTIVVFDRIRENLRYYSKKMSFGEIVNASVNQTLARSINTSLTTLITLLALYFFGGVTTKDFVLAMILGIAIGTYSSIFFCSVLVDFWEDKKNNKTPASKSAALV